MGYHYYISIRINRDIYIEKSKYYPYVNIARHKIPYFEPDFSDLFGLIDKIKTYAIFS